MAPSIFIPKKAANPQHYIKAEPVDDNDYSSLFVQQDEATATKEQVSWSTSLTDRTIPKADKRGPSKKRRLDRMNEFVPVSTIEMMAIKGEGNMAARAFHDNYRPIPDVPDDEELIVLPGGRRKRVKRQRSEEEIRGTGMTEEICWAKAKEAAGQREATARAEGRLTGPISRRTETPGLIVPTRGKPKDITKSKLASELEINGTGKMASGAYAALSRMEAEHRKLQIDGTDKMKVELPWYNKRDYWSHRPSDLLKMRKAAEKADRTRRAAPQLPTYSATVAEAMKADQDAKRLAAMQSVKATTKSKPRVSKPAKSTKVKTMTPQQQSKVEKEVQKSLTSGPAQNKTDSRPKPTSGVAKGSTGGAIDEKMYCFCAAGRHGKMIGCDNFLCEREWFHYTCVGVLKKPKGGWLCPVCRDQPKKEVLKHDTEL